MSLGDRMKMYENTRAVKRVMPLLPVCMRLDGNNFHNFCKGLQKPYDLRLMTCMQELTKYLMNITGAIFGYTQSDEISLILYSPVFNSSIFFDGKIDKMLTISAAKASVMFNKLLGENDLAKYQERLPIFDNRLWSLPTLEEVSNYIIWREQDATRNSIQSAGQRWFSHNQLHKKSCNEIQDMLFVDKSVNWNEYPTDFKRGSYFKRVVTNSKFTTEEISKLPEKHEARLNPELTITRQKIVPLTIDLWTSYEMSDRISIIADKNFVGGISNVC